MQHDIVQLDFNEYLAYLLLYAANADFEIEKEELEIIERSVSHDDYEKVRKAFEKATDAERLEVIMHYKKVYVNTLMSPDAVMAQLKEVFMADEEYPSVEKAVFIYLKKLLNL
jgi:hypothetical protein